MKITITPTGGSATILCDGDTRGQDLKIGPQDVNLTLTAANQIDQYIDASFVALYDKGNKSGTVRFTVSVLCATNTAAASFAFNYPATLARYGKLRVFEESTPTVYTEYDAHIANVDTRQIGVTVFVSYGITITNHSVNP